MKPRNAELIPHSVASSACEHDGIGPPIIFDELVIPQYVFLLRAFAFLVIKLDFRSCGLVCKYSKITNIYNVLIVFFHENLL